MHKYVHTYRWLTPLQRAWIFHCTESMRTIYSSMYVFTGKQVKICSVCTVCMKTFNLSVCMYVWMILCVFLTSSISMFACWLYVCIMSVFELYVCMCVCRYISIYQRLQLCQQESSVYVCILVYVCMYVNYLLLQTYLILCMYVCVYVCMQNISRIRGLSLASILTSPLAGMVENLL